MKLTDIPVVYICPDHTPKYTERKRYTQAMLEEIGFRSITHYKSGTEDYPTCLAKATIAVLEARLDDSPFILLEDDCEPFLPLDTATEITFPDDTDALYMGFSVCAGSPTENRDDGRSVVEPYSPSHIRILNMLSAHAILYRSMAYKQAVIEAMYSIIGKPGYHSDVILSRLHTSYRIYGYYHPFFYQSEKFGNTVAVRDATKIAFASL